MELFKTNGQLKPRGALVAHHRVYVTELAKQVWIKEREAEHKTLFPLKIDNPAYVVPLDREILNPAYVVDGLEPYMIPNPDYVEPLDELIDNPDFISYDEWMAEEVITTAYQEATYSADGFTLLTPEIQEVKSLAREFVEPPYDEVELDNYLASNAEYKAYNDKLKQKELDRVIVTTSTGKQFYGDEISRVDISDAIAIAEDPATAQTSTMWKLSTGLELVTLDDLKEARILSLQAKGAIIGV